MKNLTVIFALGCASTLIATQSVAAYESADSSYHENSIPIQNKPDAWASVERFYRRRTIKDVLADITELVGLRKK